MSGPLRRRRLELYAGRGLAAASRSDPALPSPVTDLANNLSATSLGGSSPGDRRRPSCGSSDEADTPTTSAVLGGRHRSRRLLRDVTLDESTPEGAAGPLRRFRSLPVRQRLLACSPDLGSPHLDKENAPFLASPVAKQAASAAAAAVGPFEFSSPKRMALSSRSGQRAPDCAVQRRLPLGEVQRPAAATPSPSLSSEPPETQDPSSQDSGYGAADRDEFRFAAPMAPPPRRVRSSTSSSSSCGSPCAPAALRRTGSDGFLDAIDLDTMDESGAMPAGLQSLLSAPILHSPAGADEQQLEPDVRLRRPAIRRFLSMVERSTAPAMDADMRSPLADRIPVPVPGRLGQFKRPDPPTVAPGSPTRKRLCSLAESPSPPRPAGSELQRSESHRLTPTSERVRPLQRCHSESEATIKRAVQRSCQDPDLIGDCSRPYSLPLASTTRNHDLKAISADTLGSLLDGKFRNVVASYQVVDCRYPYEFEGGHIKGAVNLYTRDAVHKHLLAGRRAAQPPPPDADSSERRHVLVFHCEYSSERGPSMYRFLREQDRKLNKQTYPALLHPEVYLLEGGYKQFYETFAGHENRCEPSDYRPMNKEGHEGDLKHFRAKSKSWAGDSRARGVSKRMFL